MLRIANIVRGASESVCDPCVIEMKLNKKIILAMLALGGVVGNSFGQGNIPGNILVVRVGTNAAGTAMNSQGTGQVLGFLDAVKASSGQSFSRFTTLTTATMSFDGLDPTSGMISRNPAGTWCLVAGYSGTAASGNISQTVATTTPTVANNRVTFELPFTASTANAPGAVARTYGTNFSAATIRGAATNDTGQVFITSDWAGLQGTFFPINSGTGTAAGIFTTAGPRHIVVHGGFIFFSTATGIFRAPISQTAVTPVQVASGTNLCQFDFVNSQTLIAADITNGVQRFTLSGTDTWGNYTGSPVTGTGFDATAGRGASGIATDGYHMWFTNQPANFTLNVTANTLFSARYPVTGTVAPTATFNSGTIANNNTNSVFRGVCLSPEPPIIGSAPTGTSGQVRFAMRQQGTPTDAFIRGCKIGTTSFSNGRTATVDATIPMRGHFADMTVDRNGNTLILCIVPNATSNGWVYSIIRVSPDGTQTDEGPVTSGFPSQVVPAGFLPVSIRASATRDEAAVLMWNPTANTARLGIVTLPTTIGAGVSTIADWGPYTPTTIPQGATDTANMRANALAYSRVGDQPNILWSWFNVTTPTTNNNGSWEVRTITGPASANSAQFATTTNVLGFRAIGLAFDGSDNARILQSGGHNWFVSSASNSNPQQFRVETWASGGTTALVQGTQYTRNGTVNNSVTSQPIFSQVQPTSIYWDAANGTANINMIGMNGTQVPNVLAGDQRLNIPGAFRAWQMTGSTNNVNASTYRFFPGSNF